MKTFDDRQLKAGLLMGLVALACPAFGAGPIYKCVAGGKTNFTSDAQNAAGDCQVIDLKVVEPNPADAARQIEKNRADAEREKAEDERRREELKNDADVLRRAERLQEAKMLSRAHSAAVRSALARGGRRRGGSYR